MAWYNPLTWGEGERVELDPNLGKLPEADRLRRQMEQGLMTVQGRAAPQAGRTVVGPVRTGQAAQLDPRQQEFRARSLGLADQLGRIASGQQAGAGELAARRNAARAIAQQQSLVRAQRGGNAALAAATAARQTGDIGLAGAGMAQQAAIQDQQAAMGQLGGVLATGRGQDIDVAGQNAQLKQSMNLANLSAENQRVFQQAGLDQAGSLANMQAKLATMGMNDQASLGYLSQLFGVSQAEMQGLLAAEQTRIGNYKPPITGDLLQAGGTVGAAALTSDREAKKDVRKVSASLDRMLDHLEPYAYKYKDDKHGEGRRAGIMAQDLERSEAGRRIVRTAPEGTKVLDVNAAISAALASAARLHRRVRQLEGKAK